MPAYQAKDPIPRKTYTTYHFYDLHTTKPTDKLVKKQPKNYFTENDAYFIVSNEIYFSMIMET